MNPAVRYILQTTLITYSCSTMAAPNIKVAMVEGRTFTSVADFVSYVERLTPKSDQFDSAETTRQKKLDAINDFWDKRFTLKTKSPSGDSTPFSYDAARQTATFNFTPLGYFTESRSDGRSNDKGTYCKVVKAESFTMKLPLTASTPTKSSRYDVVTADSGTNLMIKIPSSAARDLASNIEFQYTFTLRSFITTETSRRSNCDDYRSPTDTTTFLHEFTSQHPFLWGLKIVNKRTGDIIVEFGE